MSNAQNTIKSPFMRLCCVVNSIFLLRNALSQSQNGNYFVIKRQIAFDGQSKQRDAIITKRQKSNKNQIAAVKIPQNALLK